MSKLKCKYISALLLISITLLTFISIIDMANNNDYVVTDIKSMPFSLFDNKNDNLFFRNFLIISGTESLLRNITQYLKISNSNKYSKNLTRITNGYNFTAANGFLFFTLMITILLTALILIRKPIAWKMACDGKK